jgi:hypothetical protein
MGCTNIPLAAGEAQENETNLGFGFSSHGAERFVQLDPPGHKVLEDYGIRFVRVVKPFSLWRPQ